jgi:hypothetical protein
MATASLEGALRHDVGLIDQWFRALDQRRNCFGMREWHVQVTSILVEKDVLWIQIADAQRQCASVLLRVVPTTPVEQAVQALRTRGYSFAGACPTVVSTTPAHVLVS